MAEVTVEVYDVRQLRKDLRQAAKAVPDKMAAVNLAAAEIVATEAKRRAPKGPHQGGGHVDPIESSIRARGTRTRGEIVFGGQRSPHAPVYEFGGSIPRRGARSTHGAQIKTAQRKHLGFAYVGVSTTTIEKRPYVYPAIKSERHKVVAVYEAGVARALRELDAEVASLRAEAATLGAPLAA